MIGPMGSGKSTVGAALASRLGMKFIDTDQLVEDRSGRSISEIFEHEGEEAFRKLESEAVLESVRNGSVVIACGGGAVLETSNVEALQAAGRVFFLKVGSALAAKRLEGSLDRPLLQRLGAIALEREELYRRAADFEIDAAGTVEQVVDLIISKASA